ncbi:hypothetical protein OROHE_020541 [Orobanche hederae]
MTQREGNVPLDANAELEPSNLEHMYQELRNIVWVVIFSTEVAPGSQSLAQRYYTGFCMNKNGYIITSRESGQPQGTYALRLEGDHRAYDATIVHMSEEHGYVILKIGRICDYGILGSRDPIDLGMNVFTIAHKLSSQASWTYLLFKGRVASMPRTKKSTHQYGSRNKRTLQKFGDDQAQFVCIGGAHLGGGHYSYGGPIFNSMGHIIGMIATVDKVLIYALLLTDHVNIGGQINDFIDVDIGGASRPSKKQRQSKDKGDSGPSQRN